VKKTVVKVKNMHCRSCELLIEDKLKEIESIKEVKADYREGKVEILSKTNLDLGQIKNTLLKIDYELGRGEKKTFLSRNFNDYKDLAIGLVIFILLYFILKNTGLFNFGSSISQKSSNLLTVVLVGLTAGFSTCMALVGGLILSLSARHNEKHPEATSAEKFRPHLFFNFGRIISFIVLGGIIGLVGNIFELSSVSLGILIIIVGIVMLFLGLQLTEILPRLSSNGFTLPKSITRMLGIKNYHQKEYNHKNALILGALTFFLPCGFTQAMQIYAISTGSFLSGALIMGLFALGTAPGLLGVGGLTSVLKGLWAKRFFKFVGVLVIFLAIFNIKNGFNLTGFNIIKSLSSNKGSSASVNVAVQDGQQIVRMDQVSAGYSPNNFTIKQNIPTKWIINSKNPNSCAASIIAPKLGIKKYLSAGENIIEFVPREVGKIQFTCSMGMYRGYFNVIENKEAVSPPEPPSAKINTEEEKYKNANILKASYTYQGDIDPKEFSAKVDEPTILEIEVRESGYGCMGSIVLPGLNDEIEFLKKGENLSIKFIAKQKGTYEITCGMGTPRGYIKIN